LISFGELSVSPIADQPPLIVGTTAGVFVILNTTKNDPTTWPATATPSDSEIVDLDFETTGQIRRLVIEGKKAGSETITVAVEVGGMTTSTRFTVRVEELAKPTVPITNRDTLKTVLRTTSKPINVTVDDANSGDTITTEATASPSGIVTISPPSVTTRPGDNKSFTFTLTGAEPGTATVTVKATDDSDARLSSEVSFEVLVNRNPMLIAGAVPTEPVVWT